MLHGLSGNRFGVLLVALTWGSAAVFGADSIPGVGPTGEIVKVHGDLQFTEGPAWDGKGSLYFSDVPASKIYKSTDGKLSVFLDPSGNSNGLMINAAGKIFSCQMEGRVVSI